MKVPANDFLRITVKDWIKDWKKWVNELGNDTLLVALY